ncbi:MAG: DEAD/DEAH box helicase, partial [Thermoplasmata archaeon]
MRVADLGLDPRIVDVLKEQGIEELYPPQADAIGPALLGENLVLAIPTASGKSLVAYLAILASVLRGGKALYIVPLRALAAEKYDDLKEFERLGIKVGISVGDYDSIDPNLEKFDVIVATSERADSLLRHRINWLQQLTVVVADEVHLINDADRGPTLEITLAKLRQVNPKAQVLALSATIKNSDQLAKWLEAEHVKSNWRPVPLKEGVYHEGLIHFVDKSISEIKGGEDDISGLVADIMSTGGQALVFVNTRRSTEALAKALGSQIRHELDEKRREHL